MHPLAMLPRRDAIAKWLDGLLTIREAGRVDQVGREQGYASGSMLGEPLPVELMNTVEVDRSGPRDMLGDDAAVSAWLRAIGERSRPGLDGALVPAKLNDAAVRRIAPRLRELRDALRRLAAEATADPRPVATSTFRTRQDAVDALNALASTWPELSWPVGGAPTKVFQADGTPAQLAVAAIAHEAVELFASARRDQLRACLAPGCLRYFFKEHPRREWCSDACGNRVRVARHYQRRHPGGHRTGRDGRRRS